MDRPAKAACRMDRSNPPRNADALRGKFIRNPACQSGRCQVDLGDTFSQAVFSQGQAVGTEGVCDDHIHPGFQERAVDLFHGDRVTDHQVVDAAVGLFAAVMLGGQVHGLQIGAHDTPGDQHMFRECLKIFCIGVCLILVMSASPGGIRRRIKEASRITRG